MEEAAEVWQDAHPLDYVLLPPALGEGEEAYGYVPEAEDTSTTCSNDDSEFGSKSKEIEFSKGSVSGLNECNTDTAKRLCIFDLALKLTTSDQYDLGGTYTRVNSQLKSELWFYCTTSVCPRSNFLLNIFCCFRREVNAYIGISSTNTLYKKRIFGDDFISTYLTLPETISWKVFKSCEKDESHLLKTYCFSKEDLKILHKQIVCIPLRINMNVECAVNEDTLRRIQRHHNFSGLFKRQENSDFLLQSKSGKQYDVHKLLLAAHSSVLRNAMKKMDSDFLALNIDDDGMEQFLQYIYSGSIKNISEPKWGPLIELADRLKLENLLNEAELIITQQISIKNAIEFAVMAEKYKLVRIQNRVIDFITSNSKVLKQVMDSDGWKNLQDVNLAKKLFKKISILDGTDE